jgi:hypothetical protein
MLVEEVAHVHEGGDGCVREQQDLGARHHDEPHGGNDERDVARDVKSLKSEADVFRNQTLWTGGRQVVEAPACFGAADLKWP